MTIQVGLSAGELIDRITILEIKAQRLSGSVQTAVRRDLALARDARDRELPHSEQLQQLSAALHAVNLVLWQLEERLRQCEGEQRFDGEFVALARSVYQNNDRRAALKQRIDAAVNGDSTDYKSHALPDV